MNKRERQEIGRSVLNAVLASLNSGIVHYGRHREPRVKEVLRKEAAYAAKAARQTIKSL